MLMRHKWSSITSIFIVLLILETDVSAEEKLSFEALPNKTQSHQFVENTQCLKCHSKQAKEWQTSHHAQAMQEANKLTVKGDFNNISFTHNKVNTSFFRLKEEFFVNTIGPDGKATDFKVKYTFGVEPLQQYIVELDDGHLQTLDVAWDTRPEEKGGQKWFQLAPDNNAKVGEPLHWTGLAYNWNNRCAECHSTNVEKQYDLATDSYSTTWSEINVSCQSCHGPGSKHLEWLALSDTAQKQKDKGLIVDYKNNNQRYQLDTCARCHSRRHQVSPIDSHGKAFFDDYLPSQLSENLYHPDGQILDEVFVYGSFLQSKMYAKGVGCVDCHNPHSGNVKLTGNALCLQCHQDTPPKQRFPSLQAKNYDAVEHHFHKQDSEGAQCVNCHMPATTYMEIDPRRDHSFKIPNPALSLKIGSPNACTSCHQDKPIEWAKEAMAEWYGSQELNGQSYGELIYATRKGDPAVLHGLVGSINNPETPAIQTATLIAELVKYFPDPEAIKTNTDSLKHPDPLVRASAAGNLDQIPVQYRLPLVTPLLDDPVLAVRIDAARVAAAIPANEFGENISKYDAAIEEYINLQHSLADTPEAHLNLGVLYTDLQKYKLAEQELKQAITLNSYFLPAYINLANLYNRLGQNKEAEQEFRKALNVEPDNGEIYYSLGLLLAEQNRFVDAVVELAKATKLLPERTRIAYNYALSLQHIKQYASAEAVLKQVYAKAPDNREIVHALVIIYGQQQKWLPALEYAKRLVELSPGEDEPARLLQQIEYQIQH